MTLPGTVVTSRASSPPRGAPTDTGVWFICGITERGPVVPTLVTSLTDFVTKFGNRITASATMYDSVEAFFRSGGSRCYVSRVAGPSPVLATGNLFDQSGSSAPGDVSLRVDAVSYGTWANSLNVVVDDNSSVGAIPAGSFRITVTDDVLGTLEVSPDLADRDAAVAWAANSDYIRLVLGASAEDPRDGAAVSLAGGTDDNGSAVDANWLAALDKFTVDYGPGQVSYPGRTSDTALSQLFSHASTHNRVAIGDLPDTATKATLKASAAALRAISTARYGAVFAPWAIVPGITPGTTRTIPYSAIQAGMIAKLDGLGESPNVAAAGVNGVSDYATGLSQVAWSDTDREDLNDSGVNVVRVINEEVRTYGYRTPANPLTEAAAWLQFSNSRLNMACQALGNNIIENYVFAEIDGKGVLFAKLAGELTGMLVPFYEAGSLYGETPEEAFLVDTGDQVNTDETIAAGEIHAVIALRMSPFGERVVLEFVKVANTEAVA